MIPSRHSIVLRYLAVSILATVLPLAVVGVLYDRYSSGLVDTLAGERLERRLTAIEGRLSAFLNARFYELETLAEYPAIIAFVTPPYLAESDLEALVQFEADQPDLYGILFFKRDGTMARAVAGQAAAGPPYWGAGEILTAGVARIASPRGEVVGPIGPGGGRPASLLLVRKLRPRREPELAGKIALHVRLASMTELMGPEDEAGLFRPLLLSPSGIAYSNVGVPEPRPQNIISGPEILPGWRPVLAVEWERLAAPLQRVRVAFLAGIAVAIVLLVGLFLRLSRGIVHRVHALVEGANAVAAGNLAWRIEVGGRRGELASLAQAFNDMARRLQQVIRSSVEVEKMAVLGQFATGVAHEVRNPLAAMKTSVQALLGREPDAERRSLLAGMGEEIDRLDDTVDDLLNFARPRKPRLNDVPVHEVCRRVTLMVETQAEAGQVAITNPEGAELWVRVDEGHLQQILMNLILNAMQAMPEGGHLSLRTQQRGRAAVLEVSDTGSGITAEALGQITDPFYTTRPGGTGLGLAITRQLAEMNKATIDFASEPGKGTVVTITVPLSDKR